MRRLFKFSNKWPATPLRNHNLNKDFLGALLTYFIFMKYRPSRVALIKDSI